MENYIRDLERTAKAEAEGANWTPRDFDIFLRGLRSGYNNGWCEASVKARKQEQSKAPRWLCFTFGASLAFLICVLVVSL